MDLFDILKIILAIGGIFVLGLFLFYVGGLVFLMKLFK